MLLQNSGTEMKVLLKGPSHAADEPVQVAWR